MSSFWSLTGFEYKKILQKRSVWIMLLLALLVSAASVGGTLLGNTYVEGEVYESYYEAMVKDRNYARMLDGRALDGQLIMEAAEAYAKITDSDNYQSTANYQTFARPYSAVSSISRAIFSTAAGRFTTEDFQALKREQAEQFYSIRRDRQVQLVEDTGMSDKAKAQVLALDAQVQTPFKFSYVDGYTRFFVITYTLGLTAAFVMAVCVAPLFSGEYVSRADQLILASKHGKHKLILAKLFTGFSLAAAICLVLTAAVYLCSMLLFGSDGVNAPLQLYTPMSPYPLNMGQTALILATCVFFACLMTAAVTMLLSARLKSPFGVIILVSLLLIVPMFVNANQANLGLYKLLLLLPTNMMAFGAVTGDIQYQLAGLVIRPYVFMPLFAAGLCVLLAPLAYRSFKNHQIA
jgi:ABC-type transport system involved in multi-copper enzyme maturation permease subunit